MTTFKYQKIFRPLVAFAFGTLFLAFLLEGVLRFIPHNDDIDFVFYDMDTKLSDHLQKNWSAKKDDFVIAVFGNSYSAGVGAKDPKTGAYSYQLEQMLKRQYPHKNIKVINFAVAGANSYVVRRIAEVNIDENVDLILLRAGEPNVWNTLYYDRYLEEVGKIDFTLLRYMRELRLWRFISSLDYQISNFRDDSYTRSEFYLNAMKNYRKEDALWNLENRYRPSDHLYQAFKKLYEQYPYDFDISLRYFYLAVKRNDLYICEQLVTKWIDDFNSNKISLKQLLQSYKGVNFISRISRHYPEEISPDLAKNLDIKYKKYTDLNSGFIQKGLEEESVHGWITHDLNKISNMAKSYKSKLVLLTYPPYGASGETTANNVIRSFSAQNSIPLIDVGKNMEDLKRQGQNIDSWYCYLWGMKDNHLSAKGYGETAKLVYKYIAEHNFL